MSLASDRLGVTWTRDLHVCLLLLHASSSTQETSYQDINFTRRFRRETAADGPSPPIIPPPPIPPEHLLQEEGSLEGSR